MTCMVCCIQSVAGWQPWLWQAGVDQITHSSSDLWMKIMTRLHNSKASTHLCLHCPTEAGNDTLVDAVWQGPCGDEAAHTHTQSRLSPVKDESPAATRKLTEASLSSCQLHTPARLNKQIVVEASEDSSLSSLVSL